MLVLSRKVGQRIIIGDNIVVEVRRIKQEKSGLVVILSISAPKEISIHREEVYEAIKRKEKEDAESHQAESASDRKSPEDEYDPIFLGA